MDLKEMVEKNDYSGFGFFFRMEKSCYGVMYPPEI